jgi:arylsulfatase A-like enzyme
MNTISQSYSLKRSGDVVYLLQEGWHPVIKNKPLNYSDQQILPLVFYGNGIKPGTDYTPYQATDLLPTLSEIMGIPLPEQSKGRTIEKIRNF